MMYVQKKIHIIEIHSYPSIKFEAIKVHGLKADMQFTVIDIYTACKMLLQELLKENESNYKT